MNWTNISLYTFCLFLPVFVNSLGTKNFGKENVALKINPINSSSSGDKRENHTYTKDDSNILNKTVSDGKQPKRTASSCGESVTNGNETAQNISRYEGKKPSKEDNTESFGSSEKNDFVAKETSRRARKLDKYQLKKEIFTGRGKEMELLLPLVIGFKLTGAISSGFTAIKIFLLQSMFIAKLAVIASGFLLLKNFYDFHKPKPMMHKLPTDLSPYYDYTVPYHSTHDSLGYQLGYDNGQWHGVAGADGDTDIGTANEDLDKQYSNSDPVFAEHSNINNQTSDSYSNYYSQPDYAASERLSNTSTREKYKPLIIGYETYVKRITTEKRED